MAQVIGDLLIRTPILTGSLGSSYCKTVIVSAKILQRGSPGGFYDAIDQCKADKVKGMVYVISCRSISGRKYCVIFPGVHHPDFTGHYIISDSPFFK
jgi:hypothetical protein